MHFSTLVLGVTGALAAVPGDLVTSLPGYDGEFHSKQYSVQRCSILPRHLTRDFLPHQGYISIGENKDRHIHCHLDSRAFFPLALFCCLTLSGRLVCGERRKPRHRSCHGSIKHLFLGLQAYKPSTQRGLTVALALRACGEPWPSWARFTLTTTGMS
jgi:hypothetical protein